MFNSSIVITFRYEISLKEVKIDNRKKKRSYGIK